MKSDYNELSKHERKLINQFIACLHICLTDKRGHMTNDAEGAIAA